MSFNINSLIFMLSCFTSAMYVDGFLLNPDQTSSPGITSQYISMDMYLAEKKELRNQIFQFQRENGQTLQLLTTQLQQKLTVMDDKLKQSYNPNDTIELAHLEQKNRDLEMNLTILQEKHQLLQIHYVRQKDQLDLLKNTSAEVIKELSELKQLKIVNQTLDLHVVQGKIQSLEQKTNLLTNNQNARSEDFLALYNVTRVTDNNVKQIGKQLANLFSSNTRLNATIGKHYGDLNTRFHDVETNLNTTFDEVVSKINSLAVNVSTNSKKGYDEMLKKGKTVAFSVYSTTSQKLSTNLKVIFEKVWTNVGNAYDPSTGIFTAPHAGLYHITSTVMTRSGDRLYLRLYHNNLETSGSFTTGSGYRSGSFDVVFSLQKGDDVFISGSSDTVYSDSGQYITFSGHSIF